MANRQTRALKKKGLCTHNEGPTTTVKEIKHGPRAFMTTDNAIRFKKERGIFSWRINQNHPANVPIGKR